MIGDTRGASDALFDLPDVILCSEGPVDTLVGLSPVPERRRGRLLDLDRDGRAYVAAPDAAVGY